jgi:hypothetical protein
LAVLSCWLLQRRTTDQPACKLLLLFSYSQAVPQGSHKSEVESGIAICKSGMLVIFENGVDGHG